MCPHKPSADTFFALIIVINRLNRIFPSSLNQAFCPKSKESLTDVSNYQFSIINYQFSRPFTLDSSLLTLAGLAGNHPFLTLSTCSATSLMLQKELNEATPNSADATTPSTASEPARKMMPATKKHHLIFSPK